MGWAIKSYLGPAEIASFSCRDLYRSNKHDLFWLVVSASYLDILFLWAIVVLDFLPLELHKHFSVESIALLNFALWHCFNTRWILSWGIRSCLRPAEIASFSCRYLTRRNKHDLFWLNVSARYLYILFLWSIFVSVFRILEVHKHLRAESIGLLIFVLWHCFNNRWILGWGIKPYLGPAELECFSWRDLSRRNKDDLFWLVVSARYLYILFLWAIVVSDFLPLEINQHLRAKSRALLIFVLWHCFISRWIVGWG